MAQDIIDAEFSTVARPPQGGSDTPARPAAPAADEQVGILRGSGSPLPRRRRSTWSVAGIALAIIAVAFAANRLILNDHARARIGQTPLEIIETPTAASVTRANVVTVSATIRNVSGIAQTVPDVVLTFEAAPLESLVYRIPRGERLEPGGSLAFTVRMPKKPGYDEAPRLAFNTHGA